MAIETVYISCPSCHSERYVDNRLDYARCPHCGSLFQVDSARILNERARAFMAAGKKAEEGNDLHAAQKNYYAAYNADDICIEGYENYRRLRRITRITDRIDAAKSFEQENDLDEAIKLYYEVLSYDPKHEFALERVSAILKIYEDTIIYECPAILNKDNGQMKVGRYKLSFERPNGNVVIKMTNIQAVRTSWSGKYKEIKTPDNNGKNMISIRCQLGNSQVQYDFGLENPDKLAELLLQFAAYDPKTNGYYQN